MWFAAAIAGVGEARPEGRWGYADAEGEIVVPARFQAAGDFADGRALVLLDDVYTFIDTTGATVAPLVQAGEIAPLPAVPSGCSELACYVAALGGEVDTWSIVANPGRGEELLELEVRKLGYGAVEVRERGWEGSSHVLVLPGRAPEDASVLLKALLRDVAMRDVSQDGIFPGDIATWQLDATEAAAEFYGIRVRGAGVEIHHTVWES